MNLPSRCTHYGRKYEVYPVRRNKLILAVLTALYVRQPGAIFSLMALSESHVFYLFLARRPRRKEGRKKTIVGRRGTWQRLDFPLFLFVDVTLYGVGGSPSAFPILDVTEEPTTER